MSEINYLPGKEPDAREHRLIFKNIDRVGWDPSIDCYLTGSIDPGLLKE